MTEKISNQPDHIRIGQRTLEMEVRAIQQLSSSINQDFHEACELIRHCKGRTIITGMGKSGHIGNKIAATLASTGTPSFFVHPGEASHGDLGMITTSDVVIGISNSGNSSEIITLLPILKRLQIPLISMTGNPDSTLAKAANINLDVSVECEACPLDLAPTSSTTATLVMGDALAVSLLEARGFTAEDFAFSHPGGTLGKRLLLKISDVMHTGKKIPSVLTGTSLSAALLEMTNKGLGMTTILNQDNQLLGIFTDGDLRRALDSGKDIHQLRIDDVMSISPTVVNKNNLAAEALSIMESHSITALVVTNDSSQPKASPAGIIHMHDLLRAGII